MPNTVYAGIPNSPAAKLLAPISALDTEATLDYGSYLPAAPNICTFGTGEDAETVMYATKVGNVISGLTRDLDGSGAQPWGINTVVRRGFCNYDWQAAIDKIGTGNGPISHTALGDLTGTTGHTGLLDVGLTRALTGMSLIRSVDNSSIILSGGFGIAGNGAIFQLYGKDHATYPGKFVIYVPNAAKSGNVQLMYADGATNTPTPVFAGLKMGATASVTDGATITHGCGTTPTSVVCTASVAGEIISVTAKGATTFTVAIKKHDGSAGTSQTVNWIAWL
jgi:hypothetical protein